MRQLHTGQHKNHNQQVAIWYNISIGAPNYYFSSNHSHSSISNNETNQISWIIHVARRVLRSLCKFNYLHHERIRSIADYLSLRVYNTCCCHWIQRLCVRAPADACLWVRGSRGGSECSVMESPISSLPLMERHYEWPRWLTGPQINIIHRPVRVILFKPECAAQHQHNTAGTSLFLYADAVCWIWKKSLITPNPIRINIIKRAAWLLLENDGTPHA